MKRWKTPDYSRHKVFGVPLLVVLQRTGQPLPQCMLRAMRCLRRTALDAVGIFRKSGVRSRIQKLRDQIEVDPGELIFFFYCDVFLLEDVEKIGVGLQMWLCNLFVRSTPTQFYG